MRSTSIQSPSEAQALLAAEPSRRGFFWGTAAAAAAATVVSRLPLDDAPVATGNSLPEPPKNGGGYSLSAHVQHYYKTARV